MVWDTKQLSNSFKWRKHSQCERGVVIPSCVVSGHRRLQHWAAAEAAGPEMLGCLLLPGKDYVLPVCLCCFPWVHLVESLHMTFKQSRRKPLAARRLHQQTCNSISMSKQSGPAKMLGTPTAMHQQCLLLLSLDWAMSRALPVDTCHHMQYTTYLHQAMHWLGVDACQCCCCRTLAPMWCSQCCSIGSRPSRWWWTALCTPHSCWLQQGWRHCFRSHC